MCRRWIGHQRENPARCFRLYAGHTCLRGQYLDEEGNKRACIRKGTRLEFHDVVPRCLQFPIEKPDQFPVVLGNGFFQSRRSGSESINQMFCHGPRNHHTIIKMQSDRNHPTTRKIPAINFIQDFDILNIRISPFGKIFKTVRTMCRANLHGAPGGRFVSPGQAPCSAFDRNGQF